MPAARDRRGDLHRPARDRSRRHIRAIRAQQISRLDGASREERTVSWISPRGQPDLLATHTCDRLPGISLIDGLRRLPRPGPWRER